MEQRLFEALKEALSPTFLEVINESHLHAGHAGSPGTGGSHFCVRITAPSLEVLSRVEAQRRIYASVGTAWQEGLHALRIELVKNQD